MKIFDENDFEGSIKYIVDLCEDFESSPDYHKALSVCLSLSTMKLIVGIDKFNTLPIFVRWLDMSTKIVKENENKENI